MNFKPRNIVTHFFLSALCLCFSSERIFAQTSLPSPAHIVILVLEDHSFNQIIGSSYAPYINSLTTDSNTALFTQSFAITHPSQPNYLHLFSGCSQGVTNNLVPAHPVFADNLGRQLLDSGKTFYSYHEDLPYPGFDGISNGYYSRNHNPAANFMGIGQYLFPDSLVQPLTVFPSSNYNLLPTVCFVIPNDSNSMDEGNDPDKILVADTWVQNNLGGYIQWCKTNNSLFILTFDENDSANNTIPTMFIGEMVQGGSYNDYMDHHTVLRTIEDMYGLRYACDAALEVPISVCWKTTSTLQPVSAKDKVSVKILPRPFKDHIFLSSEKQLMITSFTISETSGKEILVLTNIPISQGAGKKIDLSYLPPGIYVTRLRVEGKIYQSKIVKQ